MVCSSYSHAFWLRQLFEQNFQSIPHLQMAKSQDLGFGNPSNQGCRVHQHVDGLHNTLNDCPVLILLAHSSCSSGTSQTLTVSTHKPTWSVYETLYNLLWTFFEAAPLPRHPYRFSSRLPDNGICTNPNTNLLLRLLISTCIKYLEWILVNTISIGFNSQWNFGRKMICSSSCSQEWMKVLSIEGWFLSHLVGSVNEPCSNWWLDYLGKMM